MPSIHHGVILMVEDSEGDVDLVKLALGEVGYPRQVLVARDGSQVLVVFSSSDDSGDIRGAYDRGANGCVRRPIKADAYVDTMRSIVEFWHRVNKVAC